MEKVKVVSYKEALFLKEHGFNKPTNHYYENEELKETENNEFVFYKDKLMAPTYTQANKWLRKANLEKFYVPYKEISFEEYPIIKDNRIVSDKTFAIRFCSFLDSIPKNWWMGQPHLYEEYFYMKNIAKRLLKYQIQTIQENEKQYFENIKDIIKKYE